MPLSESILIAIFCMTVVFVVLGMLWGIIRIFSSVIRGLEKRNNQSSAGTSN